MQVDLLSMVGAAVPTPAKRAATGDEFEIHLENAESPKPKDVGNPSTEDRSVEGDEKEAVSDLPNADDANQLPDSFQPPQTDPQIAMPPILWWAPVSPMPESAPWATIPSIAPMADISAVGGPSVAFVPVPQAATRDTFIPPDQLAPQALPTAEEPTVPVVDGLLVEILPEVAPPTTGQPTATQPGKLVVDVSVPMAAQEARPTIRPEAEIELLNPVSLQVDNETAAVPAPEVAVRTGAQTSAPLQAAQVAFAAPNTPKTKLQLQSHAEEIVETSPTGRSVVPTVSAPIQAVAAPKQVLESDSDQGEPTDEMPEAQSSAKPDGAMLPHTTAKTFATQKAPEKPVPDAQPAMRQVVDRIEQMVVARGGGTVTIQLEPRDLGQITLVVKQLNGRIEAEVRASEPAVRDHLATHQAQLHQQMERKGLQIETLRFTESAQNQSFQDPSNTPREQLGRDDFQRAQQLRTGLDKATVPPTPQPRWTRSAEGFDLTA